MLIQLQYLPSFIIAHCLTLSSPAHKQTLIFKTISRIILQLKWIIRVVYWDFILDMCHDYICILLQLAGCFACVVQLLHHKIDFFFCYCRSLTLVCGCVLLFRHSLPWLVAVLRLCFMLGFVLYVSFVWNQFCQHRIICELKCEHSNNGLCW